MDTLTARPNLLKQANLSLIRRVIREKGTATRSEIAGATGISVTTVRSLLAEMMDLGELESIGYDTSSGGRKAERYRFKPDRYYGAAFCITGNQIHSLLINVYGEIVETSSLEAPNDDYERAITTCLDELVRQKEIKSIGIGVPGVVEGNSFWSQNKQNYELYKIPLGDNLARRHGIPVIMENDLNATAIGFGRCYAKEFPSENPENINMAYLHFEDGCVSAGFIAGGRIIRGCSNFAGEIGLVPTADGQTLSEYMATPMDDIQYSRFVVQIICWICGILNPQYVLLGGPGLRADCVGPISDTLVTVLPKHMLTAVLYSPDMWHDYHDGMAYLTAGKMFDEIQFIKE